MSRDAILRLSISDGSVSREMPRASAVAMLKDAQDFLRAAKVLAEQDIDQPAILVNFLSPLYFLICQAMELSLKAYLRGRGYDDVALRKLSHGLEKCRLEVETQGLLITDDFRQAVSWLDKYHLAHTFRYHAERSLHVPLPGPLLLLVEPQILAIGKLVHGMVGEPVP